MASPAESRGLVDSARRLLSSLVGAIHTRLELASVEIEEQLHRAVELLLWSLVGIFAAACGVLMLGFLVIIAFWEQRVLASGIVAGAWVATAVGAFLVVRAKSRARPRVFESTLGELAKDRDTLGRP